MSIPHQYFVVRRNMTAGPDIAGVAKMLADPARAAMIGVLLDGEQYPASDLAASAGITAQTGSAHLALLSSAGLIVSTKRGRHVLYRIANHKIAEAFEALAAISMPHKIQSLRQSDESKALGLARMCYDHLAGFLGVQVTEDLVRRGVIKNGGDGYSVTPNGHAWLTEFGVDFDALSTTRRKFATQCLDWSERRPHLGGALGAALADRMLNTGCFGRRSGTRSLSVTEQGWNLLHQRFSVARLAWPARETVRASR